MQVIDLGVVGDEETRPATRPPIRRPWIAAAVALLCLLTVAAAAGPRRSALGQLWAVPFSSATDLVQVGGSTAYVLATDAPGHLSAYDVRSGARRWRVPGGAAFTWIAATRPGVVLLTGSPLGTAVTTAVDESTGETLWRRPGSLLTTSGERAVLVNPDEADSTGISLADLRTGAELWSGASTADPDFGTAVADWEDPDRLVVVYASGRVEVRDLADARLISAGQLPVADDGPDTVDFGGGNGNFLLLGHTLVVGEADGAGTISAYDTSSMRRSWGLDVGKYEVYTERCGPMLCIYPGGVDAYDPATGRLAWHRDGVNTAQAAGDGRLVLTSGDQTYQLVDATSGATVADLAESEPLSGSSGDRVYAGAPMTSGDYGMKVAELDLRSGRLFLRGEISGVVAASCQVAAETLVCPDDTTNRLRAIDLLPVVG